MKARKHLRGFDSNIEQIAVLRLCGRIDKDVLDSLRDAIRREKGPVAIDLTELTLVDREAVTLLASSEVDGIELRNCPASILEWINKQRESR